LGAPGYVSCIGYASSKRMIAPQPVRQTRSTSTPSASIALTRPQRRSRSTAKCARQSCRAEQLKGLVSDRQGHTAPHRGPCKRQSRCQLYPDNRVITLGIVGESGGGGKTTLGAWHCPRLVEKSGPGVRTQKGRAALAIGLSKDDVRALRSGSFPVVFPGTPLGQPEPSRHSVRAQLLSERVVEIHKIGTSRNASRVSSQALQEVGLDPATRHRYPHEFSGGQRTAEWPLPRRMGADCRADPAG